MSSDVPAKEPVFNPNAKRRKKDSKKILVIDVGGTNVKLRVSGSEEVRKFRSGPTLNAAEMVEGVKRNTADWNFECISIGYPGPVARGKIALEPVNIGPGWVGYDFAANFGKPVMLINDAAMQALGSYQGNRMLFLGLGTGLGTTLIIDGVVAALEMGHAPYRKKLTFEDWVGTRALKRMGFKRWTRVVFDVVSTLKKVLVADYVVLGGGNAKKLLALPADAILGSNTNAFEGGERLWESAE
jgi:polyphosphate glucokinase